VVQNDINSVILGNKDIISFRIVFVLTEIGLEPFEVEYSGL